MENLLFACCLEDAPYELADECFSRLQESYFDWNEVRVTTVRELGEMFRGIPNATANALNLKNSLQSVFESQYSFDLENLKRQNLGQAVEVLQGYKGPTQFTVAYVTQMNLGGHSIPLGKGGLDTFYIVGAVNEKEAAAGTVPGLERAIPKSKGIEFGSLLHQFAADLIASPFSQQVRGILLEIDPDCKDRLPKRVDKKKQEAERKKQAEKASQQKQDAASTEAAEKPATSTKKKPPKTTKKTTSKTVTDKTTAAKTTSKKVTVKKAKTAAEPAEKKTKATKKPAKPSTVKKKSVKSDTPAAKKAAKKKKKLVKKATKASKKSASKDLARKKPR